MTAEVAILNRSAVTLASDSAVTLRVGGTSKIYNTADKLFELSTKAPVGLMVYGNLYFSGIPLEVIIKSFRESDYCQNHDTVFKYAENFLKYLEQDIGFDKKLSNQHIFETFSLVFQSIRDELNRKFYTERPISEIKGEEIYAHFIATVNQFIERYKRLEPVPRFANTQPARLLSSHVGAFKSAVESVFANMPLSEKDHRMLRQLAGLLLHRSALSGESTGLVFAGFGKNEIFPSLQEIVIDGFVGKRLKYIEKRKIDIDRRGEAAAIVPFAQKEMVDRFLSGIDPGVENAIGEFIYSSFVNFGEAIVEGFFKSDESSKAVLLQHVQDMGAKTANQFMRDASPKIKESFLRDVQNMVLFMPKQELASMAESLVNLTSTKRRVSAEQETVGGPIDVAVITKSEGFVWVKRKHYFDPQFNPRFFQRHYTVK